MPLAEKTLKELLAARQREGARLATMLLGHITQLRTWPNKLVHWYPNWWNNSARASWNAGKKPWHSPTAPPCPRPHKTAH